MGIEYEEVRVKVKNKKTGEEYILAHQIGHRHDRVLKWKTEDFEIIGDVHVVYG